MSVMNSLIAKAFAQVNIPPPNGITSVPGVIQNTNNVTGFVCTMVTWVFWGLLVLSVAMFLIGGYNYATSGGDSEKVRKANKTLLYAAIAIIIAIVAKGVPVVLGSFFGLGANQVTGC